MIPVLITLLFWGNGDALTDFTAPVKTGQAQGVFDEELLIGILANEIAMDTEAEAIKAQAVIARTNCLRAISRGENLPEGLKKEEMMRLWGQEGFSEYYSLLEDCIKATKGIAMQYGGDYIQADFHRCSAGYTRNGGDVYGNEDYSYLKSADCRRDLVSEDFLKAVFYTPKQFVQKGAALFRGETKAAADEGNAQAILAAVVIEKRDQAGYVTELTVDGTAHSGEEFRQIYGLNSAAFALKEVDGEIRIVTKGYGHGLGASLYTADRLAKEGLDYRAILEYFYQGIEFNPVKAE